MWVKEKSNADVMICQNSLFTCHYVNLAGNGFPQMKTMYKTS